MTVSSIRRLDLGRSPLFASILVTALAGCAAIPLAAPNDFAVPLERSTLYEPQTVDWSFHSLSGRTLKERRQAYFKTLAFPTAGTNWTNGRSLATDYGLDADDTVPNGPAASYRLGAGDPLFNKLFFLSRKGKFLKVDRATPTSFALWAAPAGKTFSRTSVSMSPGGARAYVLSDDGVLYIINTRTMALSNTVNLGGGGYAIAPWLDPYASRSDDTFERVYVATNNGSVHALSVTGRADGTVTNLPAPVSYNLASGITPLFGSPYKIAASPVVLGGRIYIGDQAGNFYVYNTATGLNEQIFRLAAPIDSSPAIEIQDGSYAMTDQAETPIVVPEGQAVYAFVNAGASCAWLDLHSGQATRSQALRIDDNATTQRGYLNKFNFSTGGTTERMAAVDGGNINTEVPNQALPGYTPRIWSNDYLVPAETNTRGTATVPDGGPVVSYLRWTSGMTYTAGQVIASATLSLTPMTNAFSKVPEVRTTSPYYAGTTNLWMSNGLTNANRPVFGDANQGIYTSTNPNNAGNVRYRPTRQYSWDVSSAFAAPNADGKYALALKHEAGGTNVLWPEGPVDGPTGFAARNAARVDAMKFRNNALNADPSAAIATDTRPLLTLLLSTTRAATASIQTPPFIDALTKKAYVLNTNTLYELDWSSEAAFADADDSTNYTIYQRAYHGIPSNNANGVGGTKPACTYNNRAAFVGNFTAPMPATDLGSAYVLSRTPYTDGASPTVWNYALSKITLPLKPNANNLVSSSSSPQVTNIPGQNAPSSASTNREASAFLLADPYTGSGRITYGLSNGRIYQYDP